MEASLAIERRIREKVEKLERFHPNITACRVTIELPNQKHQKGNLFQVRIDMEVAGSLLVADRSSSKNHAHEDVYVAIRDAFNALRRQLQDYVRVRRGEVKAHEEGPSYARVAKIFPYEGFGFLTTSEGREIYFHKNSVLNDGFDRLEVGFDVRYAEEQGENGPQASTVVLAGRQRNASEGEEEEFFVAPSVSPETSSRGEAALAGG